MSTPRKETVLCYSCGKEYDRWRWDSVNCKIHSELSRKIASGQFFERICPHCGAAWREAYPLTCYHEDRKMIVCLEIHGMGAASWMLEGLLEKGQRLIRVNDQFSLSEKVACMESGRDDRIVELCKAWSKIQPGYRNRSKRIWHYFYSFENGKEEFVGAQSRETVYREAFPNQIYTFFEREILPVLKPESASGTQYDAEWATEYLTKISGSVETPGNLLPTER